MQPTTRGQAAPAMDERECAQLVDRMLALQVENEDLRWRNALLSEQLLAFEKEKSAPWVVAWAALVAFFALVAVFGVLYSWTHAAGQ